MFEPTNLFLDISYNLIFDRFGFTISLDDDTY
jgi:hypothetical protein